MSVISGHRAEEFDLFLLTPRCSTAYAVQHVTRNRIKHHVQAGISEYDHLLRAAFHDLCHQSSRLRKSVQLTVIAAVCSIFCQTITFTVYEIQHRHGQLKLCPLRLTTRHIELQTGFFKALVFLLQSFLLLKKFFLCHLIVCLHSCSSCSRFQRFTLFKYSRIVCS